MEKISRVMRKAYEYEKEYYGCSQCVLLAIQEVLGPKSDPALMAATGFAGGIGLTGSTCGALIGGVMAAGLKFGRDRETFLSHDPERVRFKSYELAMRLCKRFEEEYGSYICRDIQEKLFGRWYNLSDPGQFEEFEDAGGHGPKGCPTVVGNAARWAAELILESKDL